MPLIPTVTAVSDKVVDVAPVKFVNVVPPFVLTCHCTVGVGVPVAAAVNVAFAPAATVTLVGLVVITGAAVIVSEAAVEVTLLTELVNTASNRLPFCPAVVVKLKVVEVAPATAVKLVPPFVLVIHCTVGAGVPLAVAVKVAVAPAATDTFVGCKVIIGAVFELAEPHPAMHKTAINAKTPMIWRARSSANLNCFNFCI